MSFFMNVLVVIDYWRKKSMSIPDSSNYLDIFLVNYHNLVRSWFYARANFNFGLTVHNGPKGGNFYTHNFALFVIKSVALYWEDFLHNI